MEMKKRSRVFFGMIVFVSIFTLLTLFDDGFARRFCIEIFLLINTVR